MNAWLSHTLVQCLGWTLMHFLWQGVVIAGLLAVCLRCLRRTSANLRYLAGCAAMLLMALTPVATFYLLTEQGEPAKREPVTKTFSVTYEDAGIVPLAANVPLKTAAVEKPIARLADVRQPDDSACERHRSVRLRAAGEPSLGL